MANNNSNNWIKWVLAIFVVLGSVAFYYFWTKGFSFCTFSSPAKDSDELDHFGSYIGGIFSVAAFLIVFYQMQNDRKRFEEEKKEQDAQRRKDEFERTFFMMLEHHNNKLRFLEDKSNGVANEEGQSVSLIDFIYEKIISYQYSFPALKHRVRVIEYKEYSEINSYFLNLFRILKFINKHDELTKEKEDLTKENEDLPKGNEYSSLLRSFLSKKLLVILAQHLCDRDDSYNNYINYVNKFRFLEHMDIQDIERDFSLRNIGPINNQNNPLAYYNGKIEDYEKLVKKYNEDYGENNYISSKKNNKVLTSESLWNIDIQSQHLFIHLLSIFDNAFEGNMEYKYIKGRYQVLIDHLKNKNKTEE